MSNYKIYNKQTLTGKLNNPTVVKYPNLEDLTVTPGLEEQNFKSDIYGYNNVKVKAIETENLNVTPSLQDQNFEGIYNKVNVAAIEGEALTIEPSKETQSFDGIYTQVTAKPVAGREITIDPINEQQTFTGVYTDITVNEIQGEILNVTPTRQAQWYDGVYTAVNVNEITGETLDITPSMEQQSYDGVFTKVNVEPIEGEELNVTLATTDSRRWEGLYTSVVVGGDENLVPENIAKDKTIFGVTGTFEGTSDYNAQLKYSGTSKLSVSKLVRVINDLDLTGCPSLNQAFTSWTALREVRKLSNTSSVTETSSMFRYLYILQIAPEMDTSNVTNMGVMFGDCSALKTVPQMDASNVKNVSNMFMNCSNLQNFGGLVELGKAYTGTTANNSSYTLALSNSTLLTHDSLMNIINNLYDLNLTYDVANGGTLYTQSLILGSTNLAKLTADEIAIATNKGWTVS